MVCQLIWAEAVVYVGQSGPACTHSITSASSRYKSPVPAAQASHPGYFIFSKAVACFLRQMQKKKQMLEDVSTSRQKASTYSHQGLPQHLQPHQQRPVLASSQALSRP